MQEEKRAKGVGFNFPHSNRLGRAALRFLSLPIRVSDRLALELVWEAWFGRNLIVVERLGNSIPFCPALDTHGEA